MNLETVRLIARVLDSSWGRESSADGTYSIKYDLGHDKLTLKFTTIVQFVSEDSLKPQVDAANNQANIKGISVSTLILGWVSVLEPNTRGHVSFFVFA